MRGYECYFYYYDKQDKFVATQNHACWAGVQSVSMKLFKDDTIYIDRFENELTKKYVPLLVRIISKVTPCSIVTINGTKYIKMKVFQNYDKSLILLSFIRNLWYSPVGWGGNPSKLIANKS